MFSINLLWVGIVGMCFPDDVPALNDGENQWLVSCFLLFS